MFSKNIFSQKNKFSKVITQNNKSSSKYFPNSFHSFSKFHFNQLAKERSYGGLKDQDRIFTNIYMDGDPFIEGALKRVKKP